MNSINQNKQLIIGLIVGSLVSGLIFFTLFHGEEIGTKESSSDEKKPLYWVAPMDANYKRDKPGKSPMGMDLVPVYEEDSSGVDFGAGAIKISPEVVNNLGVRIAKVERRFLESKIKTVGYVQYDEEKLIHIHPRVEGWVEKLFVKANGDPVTKGQPLYEIYSPALVNAQEELLLALSRNNKLLIKAAEERLAALQISTQIIRQLKRTKQVVQNVTFYAAQSGVVDNLNIRQGFYVKPGTTLMSVGALDQVWVEAEIFERQVPFVKSGMPVTMTLDYLPGENWQGQVDYIYPTLDQSTRTVKVRLKFDNRDDLLKPNMFAQVTIEAKGETHSLVVPKEAVIRTGEQDRIVLALEEGRFKSIAVKLGLQDDGHFEILQGVSEGEEVVVSAQFLIDSESSKSSDFKRMQSIGNAPASVWVSATIHSLMPGHRMINATHEPVDAWQWPEMTMDFTVADSVDFSQLSEGLSLHIKITKDANGEYAISDVHLMEHGHDSVEKAVASAEVDGIVNSISHETRIINISRGPIEKWGRPAATMDFVIDEKVDMSELKTKESIRFTFEIQNGDFVIVKIDGADETRHNH